MRRVLLGVVTVGHLVQAALHVVARDATNLVSLRVEVVGHLDLALCRIVVDLKLWHAVTQRDHCALMGGGMLVGLTCSSKSLSCMRMTRRELTLGLLEVFSTLELSGIGLRDSSECYVIWERSCGRATVLRLDRTFLW